MATPRKITDRPTYSGRGPVRAVPKTVSYKPIRMLPLVRWRPAAASTRSTGYPWARRGASSARTSATGTAAAITDAERAFLTHVFRFFTQSDVEVNDCYMTKYAQVFRPTEVRMMLAAFSGIETVHILAYALLLETLGLPDEEFSAFLDIPSMVAKVDYMDTFGVRTHDDILRTTAMFGGATEGLSLYGMFAMLMNFPRRNRMKGMGQIVSWSVRDESLHAASIIRLHNTLAAGARRAQRGGRGRHRRGLPPAGPARGRLHRHRLRVGARSGPHAGRAEGLRPLRRRLAAAPAEAAGAVRRSGSTRCPGCSRCCRRSSTRTSSRAGRPSTRRPPAAAPGTATAASGDAPEIFAPEAWRGRPAEVKQGSGAALAELSAPDDVYAKAVAEAGLAYERLLAIGVAPEQARMVLPMAAMTEWFWSGSLAAWGRMCQLRQAPDAQAEAREVANQVATICVERFPISWAALRGWRPKAETGDAA
jgi:hypothetical protein